jgi:hypothetical protein
MVVAARMSAAPVIAGEATGHRVIVAVRRRPCQQQVLRLSEEFLKGECPFTFDAVRHVNRSTGLAANHTIGANSSGRSGTSGLLVGCSWRQHSRSHVTGRIRLVNHSWRRSQCAHQAAINRRHKAGLGKPENTTGIRRSIIKMQSSVTADALLLNERDALRINSDTRIGDGHFKGQG